MKRFSQFLSEAKDSQAIQQAKRLGLKSDGHGGWYDKSGEFTAKTIGDKLKFYDKNQVVGQRDPVQSSGLKRNDGVSPPKYSPKVSLSPKTQKVESKGILTVAFGRFNPPTKGHEKFLNGVAKVAGDGIYKIYPSRTIDKNKNPLDPDTKISLMRKMYPDHGERIVNDDDFKSIFDVLTKAYEDGYEAINIVVGADRQAEIEKLAIKYNGDLYDFVELNVVSVGKQDPDSDKEINLSSAKLRKAVAEKDYKTFRKGIPNTLSDEETENLFMMLADSMKIKEGCTLWKICPESDPKNLRESYIQNKIFRIGEWVENLNTGLIGKIIRRGANYLICVTEDDIMFKPWIKDVKEWTKISGVPAKQREVGTDLHRKYTMKMTGTKKIINFNIQDFINKNRKK